MEFYTEIESGTYVEAYEILMICSNSTIEMEEKCESEIKLEDTNEKKEDTKEIPSRLTELCG